MGWSRAKASRIATARPNVGIAAGSPVLCCRTPSAASESPVDLDIPSVWDGTARAPRGPRPPGRTGAGRRRGARRPRAPGRGRAGTRPDRSGAQGRRGRREPAPRGSPAPTRASAPPRRGCRSRPGWRRCCSGTRPAPAGSGGRWGGRGPGLARSPGPARRTDRLVRATEPAQQEADREVRSGHVGSMLLGRLARRGSGPRQIASARRWDARASVSLPGGLERPAEVVQAPGQVSLAFEVVRGFADQRLADRQAPPAASVPPRPRGRSRPGWRRCCSGTRPAPAW